MSKPPPRIQEFKITVTVDRALGGMLIEGGYVGNFLRKKHKSTSTSNEVLGGLFFVRVLNS